MQTQKSLWYTFNLSARTRSTIGISFFLSVNTKAGEDQYPNVKTGRERESFLFNLLFHSGLQQIGQGPVTLGGPSALLSLPIQILISSRKTLTDTLGNNM